MDHGRRSSFILRPCVSAVGAAVELPHQLDVELPRQHDFAVPDSEPLIPPIIIDTGDPLGPPRLSLDSSLGGWLFSYAAATVIMAMLALGAWVYKVPSENSRGLTAPENGSVAKGTAPGTGSPRLDDSEVVGRITGTADCRWAGPQNVPTVAVPVGRKYELASGLMEISYTSGAKVILQGPCAYEVDSPAGGFLSLGQTDARHGLPLSPLPLFIVRTPTAIVTDLGTEFGVEVDKSGATESHVFRGKIEMRLVGGGDQGAIRLGKGQSGRAAADAAGRLVVSAGAPRSVTFYRQMPKRMPINAFNTGVGLKEGDPDPHWQLVARSDDPHFKPRPAVVTRTVTADGRALWLRNEPTQSQWISTADGLPELPDHVIYTFRTTFELPGLMPDRRAPAGLAECRRRRAVRAAQRPVRGGVPTAADWRGVL